MELHLKDQLFIVSGATSGFGKAITEQLLMEGVNIIAIARGKEKLEALQKVAPDKVTIVCGDISSDECRQQLMDVKQDKVVHGLVINAGGPPAKTVMETSASDWDDAYRLLLRWKVLLVQQFVPGMIKNKYGRILFIESAAVKQPLENLVLSNSLRAGVVGMVKTLSQEIASTGVTLNVMAPGSHSTPAIDRIYKKKSEQTGIPFEQVRDTAIQQIPVGFLGEACDFASLAVWLLSPSSRFITGQTISVDGGAVKGIMG